MNVLDYTRLKTASHYQTAVFQHVADQIVALSTGKAVQSLVVEATAGSGKTTTSVAVADLLTEQSINAIAGKPLRRRMNVLFLAFNKPIAVELGKRLPAGAEAKTLNALGFGIYRRYAETALGKKVQMVDGDKVRMIMRNSFSATDREMYGEDVYQIVNKAMALGLAPSLSPLPAQGVDGKTDSDEGLMDLLDTFEMEVSPADRPTIFRMVREVLAADFADEANISFNDQKWFSVVKRTSAGNPISCFQFDAILVDEAQDLSPVDAALVKKVCKRNSIVIFVGDRDQSLYGFRGADTNAIDNLISGFSAKTLPLSITYRCAKRIVEEAKPYSSRIEARPDAPEGVVASLNKYSADSFKIGDKVVCRNNAPLVSLAFKLIAERVPVQMMGRDLGSNLIAVINNASGKRRGGKWDFGTKTVRDLIVDLDKWQDNQIEMVLAKNPDNEAGVQSVRDRYDTIRVFVSQNTDNLIESVIADIRSLFGTDQKGPETARDDKVVLSSVHRAKGLEAERVFILDRHLFMPRRVQPGSRQFKQEQNIVFVAITRAKNEVYYISSDDFR